MSKTTQKGKGKSGGFSIVAGHFHATTPKEKEFKDKLKESGVYNTELGFQNPKIVEEIDRERKDYVNNQWLPGLSSTIGECKWHICFNRVETIPTRIKASEIGIGSKKNSSPNVGVGYTIKVKGLHDLLENLRKNEDKDK